MADFLLELLSEEIPARMQARARNELARLFAECTEAAGLSTGAIDVFSTPRRLVLIARDVAERTEAMREEVKGPRINAPLQALEGFLKKTGLTREQLEERDGILFAVIDRAGRPAVEILADAIKRIVAEFAWPKSMRWGSGNLRWVRPLHGIVAILGEEIVPVEIDGIASGATTVGHRFHHPGPITIGGAHDYLEKLRACHVIVDQDERERLIREGAAAAAEAAGLQLLEDEGLVVENAGLTAWPVPLIGRFDPEFLDVPREVIVLTMRTNQKYFACTDANGALAPAFGCIANVSGSDDGEAIVEGNRRVLAARLADARFFWEHDLKVPLEEQAKKLNGIIFHERLGTVAQKAQRIEKLALWLVDAEIVKPRENTEQARTVLYNQVKTAAALCKADLVTGMVGEFPELQGIIGGYLARSQAMGDEVADAIRDHYKPIGQGEKVPTAPATVAVALADKLDNVVAFNLVKESATGSKDPYALRRSALGLIRIILESQLRLSLRSAIMKAWPAAVESWNKCIPDPVRSAAVKEFARVAEQIQVPLGFDDAQRQLVEFMASARPDFLEDVEGNSFKISESFIIDRLKVQQREGGVRHDLIDAVFALGGEDDLVRLLARVNALQSFVETDDGADLLTAYKRAANILKKENWTGPQVMSSAEEQGIPQTGEEDPLVLVEEPILKNAIAEIASGSAGADLPQEKALIGALDAAEPKASAAIYAEDFTGAMAALASLRRPIDEFFDHVTVNDPDSAKRERRLNLLMRFRDAVNQVADFSKIEG
jgi:glycyl-tRNA synthetase beta chain